jgi:hypothetical protein
MALALAVVVWARFSRRRGGVAEQIANDDRARWWIAVAVVLAATLVLSRCGAGRIPAYLTPPPAPEINHSSG